MDRQGIGRPTPWKITSGPKRTIEYPFVLKNKAEIKGMRSILRTANGRRAGLYVPLYLGDLRLTKDEIQGATTITVQKTGIATAFNSFTQYRHLALVTWEKLECYTIASVAVVGSTEVITLTAGLLTALIANETVACGLLFARFGDDAVELEYESTDVATCTVQFVELPQEYETAHAGSAPVLLYEFTRGAET